MNCPTPRSLDQAPTCRKLPADSEERCPCIETHAKSRRARPSRDVQTPVRSLARIPHRALSTWPASDHHFPDKPSVRVPEPRARHGTEAPGRYTDLNMESTRATNYESNSHQTTSRFLVLLA